MDIVTLGEILIDMFPAEIGCRLADVSAFYPKPGGAPANVAVAASRLGKQSAFIGKVGNDPFGYSLIKVMKENGVETRGLRLDNEARTTMAIIAMPDKHSAEFVFYRNPGADLCLRADELDEELLAETKILHCGSLSLVAEPARSAQFQAVGFARQHGAMISFDVNYRPSLWPDAETALEQIWKMTAVTDLLKLSENELVLLTGSSDPQQGCDMLLKEGVKLVAVTLGAKGSFYCCQAVSGFVPAFSVETVDSIGCGDAFAASLLVKFSELRDFQMAFNKDYLDDVFTYANAAGALTALNHGVIPALPDAVQVENFLRAQGKFSNTGKSFNPGG
jgi:fructokinase